MNDARPASDIAERWRLPIAACGALSLGMAWSNLFSLVPDNLTLAAAIFIGIPGLGLFFCAVIDPRFHNALSALNAERRRRARSLGWAARLVGWGLPGGDHLLLAVAVILLPTALIAADPLHKPSAAAVSFAGFGLVTVARIALVVRGYPDNQFVPYF